MAFVTSGRGFGVANARPVGCARRPRCVQRATMRDESALELDRALKLLKSKGEGAVEGPGAVYLVGTGPGDPQLLTLRAVQLMASADVVLYDRLVSNDILRYVHGGARMIYVGKEKGFHTRRQEEIHDLLYQFAEAGGSILRLKGGDPYIFGRGGEELEYLEKRGIEVTCVPGITAAQGIGAELGIPMTHRGIATSVRYITGHLREGGGEIEETFASAADEHTTLVVYMGLSNLPGLTRCLRDNGMDGCVPAVAVERGTLADQRVVFARLKDLCETVDGAELKSPTLIVIGHVVALSRKWHEAMSTTSDADCAQSKEQQWSQVGSQ